MIEQDLAMPLATSSSPTSRTSSRRSRRSAYDPGNKYSVPKDYGITAFYWVNDKVPEPPTTIKECFELLKDRSPRA